MANATVNDIIDESAQLCRIDARNAGTYFFTDDSETTHPSDGDDLARVRDEVNDILFVDDDAAPEYVADYKSQGYPAIEFSASEGTQGRSLMATDSSLAATAFWGGILVTTQDHATTDAQGTIVFRDGANWQRIFETAGAYRLQESGGPNNSGVVPAAAHALDGNLHVLAFMIEDTHDSMSMNHLWTATTNFAGTAVTPILDNDLYLGVRPAIGQTWGGGLHYYLQVDDTVAWHQLIEAASVLRYEFGADDPNPRPQAPSGGGGSNVGILQPHGIF